MQRSAHHCEQIFRSIPVISLLHITTAVQVTLIVLELLLNSYLSVMPSSAAPPTGDDDTSTSITGATAEADPFSVGAGRDAAALTTTTTTTTRVVPGGAEWWRRSFAYMTNMGMTATERAEFEADRELKREQDQCRTCEKWRDYNLDYSVVDPPSPPSPRSPLCHS